MSKDPAFLLYSSDFLTGVADMTFEERGQYITLLCLHHQKGRLSSKAVGVAVPNATADVMAKFKKDDDGLYYNERLEREALKRKAHTDKQRERALAGWEKRKKNKNKKTHTSAANATALPLENENENDIDIINDNNNDVKLFYKNQFIFAKGDFDQKSRNGYFRFVGTIFHEGEYKNSINKPANHILKIENQLTYEDYKRLVEEARKRQVSLMDMLNDMINNPKYTKGKKSVYLTLLSWIKKHPIKGTNH
jgi:hypothetical protein